MPSKRWRTYDGGEIRDHFDTVAGLAIGQIYRLSFPTPTDAKNYRFAMYEYRRRHPQLEGADPWGDITIELHDTMLVMKRWNRRPNWLPQPIGPGEIDYE